MTIAPPASIADVVRDPRWLAHRYDPGEDAFHFLPVPRAERDRATFLTDEHLRPGGAPIVVRRGDAIAAAPAPAPLHLVFHSAYCCSTLVARVLDLPAVASTLKEPVVLNDLVGWRRRGGQGADMAEVLDAALALLARPFAAGEAVVAKPSTAINALAPAILALRPSARAVLMYAPLRDYLASIAKKGIDGRLWVRTLLTGMLDDRLVDLGFTPRDHLGQTDLQVAAVGWLAHQQLFAALHARFPDRVRTLSSAALMAAPARTIAAIAALFGLTLDAEAVATGPAFARDSKSDRAYGAEQRAAERDAASALHADEIDKVATWAAAVAASAGVSLDPPAPLVTA